MTRLLMTADAVGGVWTYALELVAALAPHGVRVDLVVLGPEPSREQLAEAAAAPLASVRHSPYALEWMDQPWPEVDAAGQWLLELADALAPDVVHLNGYVHAALPWPAPVVVVGHSCVLSWWAAVHRRLPKGLGEYRRRVRAGLLAADQVVAPTAAMLAELRRWYGTTGGTVVPNCRRTDWVRPVAKEPLVVGAGRVWDPAKNLSALAALAPQLDCPTQIAGDPWLPWPQLAELLLRAAVYVAPARYEPFGLGPLEAALAGCALVLGDIPSLREVWGQAAAWVDPDDPAALRAAVHGLITDPAQRAELSQRARRRAERYRPTRTAAGYLQVYRAAAAARTTPGVSA